MAISFVACAGGSSTSESSKNEGDSIESQSPSEESSSTGGNEGGENGSSEGGAGEGQTPEPTTYTVTFDSDGGSSVESVTVKSGEKIAEPNKPSKSSKLYEYEFIGWFLEDEEWDFETDVVTQNITLVAKWKQNGGYTKPFLPQNEQITVI